MDSLVNDANSCSYIASKGQFKRLTRLLSEYFGYNEGKQVRQENTIRKNRLRITRDKKFLLALDNEEVDLT